MGGGVGVGGRQMFIDGVAEPLGKHVPQNIPAFPLGISTLEVGNLVCVPERPALGCAFQSLEESDS